MKKISVFLTFLVFIIPNIAMAESCIITSGTGNDIGDEIKCGSESFYVLSNDGTNIKMLTKYNLLAGDMVQKSKEFDDWDSADAYCNELKSTGIYDDVITTEKYIEEGPEKYFCRMYKKIETEKVLQDEKAKGLYPNGNKEVAYPLYGLFYLDEEAAFDMNPVSWTK